MAPYKGSAKPAGAKAPPINRIDSVLARNFDQWYTLAPSVLTAVCRIADVGPSRNAKRNTIARELGVGESTIARALENTSDGN